MTELFPHPGSRAGGTFLHFHFILLKSIWPAGRNVIIRPNKNLYPCRSADEFWRLRPAGQVLENPRQRRLAAFSCGVLSLAIEEIEAELPAENLGRASLMQESIKKNTECARLAITKVSRIIIAPHRRTTHFLKARGA